MLVRLENECLDDSVEEEDVDGGREEGGGVETVEDEDGVS